MIEFEHWNKDWSNLILNTRVVGVGFGSVFFILGSQSVYNRFFPNKLRRPIKLALNSPTCLGMANKLLFILLENTVNNAT